MAHADHKAAVGKNKGFAQLAPSGCFPLTRLAARWGGYCFMACAGYVVNSDCISD